jgi:hypothetical protein
MLARWFSGVAVFCLVAATTPVRAADDKPQPTLVVGVRSLETLLSDARYLASLAGDKERARQVEKMIRARIGEKGLDGIDAKRPFGLYAAFGEGLTDIFGVFMVPIADEKVFLKLLKGLKLDVIKDEDGLYSLNPDFLPKEVTVYFRFANKYAYITALVPGAVDKDKLLDPETIKPAGKTALASGVLHLTRIPEIIRDLGISQVEKNAKKAEKQSPANETEVQRQFRVQVLRELAATVVAVLKEGKDLGFEVQVDRKAGKLATEFKLTGKAESDLAGKIAKLGQRTSLFTGLAGSDSAAGNLVHFMIPENLRKTLQPMLEKRIKYIEENEDNETKRDLEVRFLKSFIPTLKAGDVDYGLDLRGPTKAGKYTAVLGLKLKDAADLEKVLRDILKVVPEGEREKVKLEADKEGDVAIHRIDIKDRLEKDKNAKKVFGDASLYMAFRKDAVFVTLGEKGLEAIKAAIKTKASTCGLVRTDITMSRLVPLISAVNKNEAITKLVKEVFGDSKDSGKIHITLDGGKALTGQLTMTGAVVHFMARAGIEFRRLRKGEVPEDDDREKEPAKK